MGRDKQYLNKARLSNGINVIGGRSMLKRFGTTRGVKSRKPAADKDYFLVRAIHLIRQRGYIRDKIVSDLLKRHLPASRFIGSTAEEELRRLIESIEIDDRTLDYLIDNVEIEILMSREREAG